MTESAQKNVGGAPIRNMLNIYDQKSCCVGEPRGQSCVDQLFMLTADPPTE